MSGLERGRLEEHSDDWDWVLAAVEWPERAILCSARGLGSRSGRSSMFGGSTANL